MVTRNVFTLILILCISGTASAEGKAKNSVKAKEQKLGGMSIVGNDEAPKSLAIVPWKSSQLGETLDALKALDGGRQPVDRDVFARQLDYYQIMAGGRETSPAAGKSRQQ